MITIITKMTVNIVFHNYFNYYIYFTLKYETILFHLLYYWNNLLSTKIKKRKGNKIFILIHLQLIKILYKINF